MAADGHVTLNASTTDINSTVSSINSEVIALNGAVNVNGAIETNSSLSVGTSIAGNSINISGSGSVRSRFFLGRDGAYLKAETNYLSFYRPFVTAEERGTTGFYFSPYENENNLGTSLRIKWFDPATSNPSSGSTSEVTRTYTDRNFTAENTPTILATGIDREYSTQLLPLFLNGDRALNGDVNAYGSFYTGSLTTPLATIVEASLSKLTASEVTNGTPGFTYNSGGTNVLGNVLTSATTNGGVRWSSVLDLPPSPGDVTTATENRLLKVAPSGSKLFVPTRIVEDENFIEINSSDANNPDGIFKITQNLGNKTTLALYSYTNPLLTFKNKDAEWYLSGKDGDFSIHELGGSANPNVSFFRQNGSTSALVAKFYGQVSQLASLYTKEVEGEALNKVEDIWKITNNTITSTSGPGSSQSTTLDFDFNFRQVVGSNSLGRQNQHVVRYTMPWLHDDLAAEFYGKIKARGLTIPTGSLTFYDPNSPNSTHTIGTFVVHDYAYTENNIPVGTPGKTLFARENLDLVGTADEKQRQLYRVVLGEKVPKLGDAVGWKQVNKLNQLVSAIDGAPSISSLTKQNATASNSLELNYLLSVDGLAVFRSALVMNGLAFEDWGDYVFQPDYKLPALDTVEAFVKREKHLPGIPTAKEIQQGGLDLALIAKENTKKIEELFLYVIELKKENDALKAKVTALEEQK
jgi:hypothetical protein